MDSLNASAYNGRMSNSITLASYQRAWLRKQAHHISPVVHIGNGGLSDSVEQAIQEALEHHELIKVKFYSLKAERFDACQHIAETCLAEIIGIVGNVGIFFRPAADPQDRQYHIPVKKVKSPNSSEEF